MIILYVDYACDWKQNIIEELKRKVEEVFMIKNEYNLTDYLGCEFHTNKNRTKGWLGEP